jgi:hypothetical protein
MSILTHGDLTITRCTDWPHEDAKWKAGRSAMELAKHWTGTRVVPADVDELLTAEFGSVHLVLGQPEKATSLPPKRSRGPRMHDLWLKGSLADKRRITICVEAKADESFGETVAEYQTAAAAALRKSPNSKMLARLCILKNMIWGQNTPVNVTSLRYQLLSALTGTAIQTLMDKSDIGVLLIHVFDTDKTTAANRYKNDVELMDFLCTVTLRPSRSTTRKGHFFGRVTIIVPADSPNEKAHSVEIYVAKLTTTI